MENFTFESFAKGSPYSIGLCLKDSLCLMKASDYLVPATKGKFANEDKCFGSLCIQTHFRLVSKTAKCQMPG
jgi:hypothetical protein